MNPYSDQKIYFHEAIKLKTYHVLKRMLDISLSLLILILFSPLFLIIPLLIKMTSRGPVFFKQKRPGKNARIFTMIKFRTMTESKDEASNLKPDSERLTGIGRMLRTTSLDEFPEIWNVLRGDMSIVGPRPLLIEYLDRYDSEQSRRHEVNPGITGWAQVNGRNALNWEEKFRYDVWYVDNLSIWLDLKILCLTPIGVLKRKGINQAGYATAEEFRGSKNPDQNSEPK